MRACRLLLGNKWWCQPTTTQVCRLRLLLYRLEGTPRCGSAPFPHPQGCTHPRTCPWERRWIHWPHRWRSAPLFIRLLRKKPPAFKDSAWRTVTRGPSPVAASAAGRLRLMFWQFLQTLLLSLLSNTPHLSAQWPVIACSSPSFFSSLGQTFLSPD